MRLVIEEKLLHCAVRAQRALRVYDGPAEEYARASAGDCDALHTGAVGASAVARELCAAGLYAPAGRVGRSRLSAARRQRRHRECECTPLACSSCDGFGRSGHHYSAGVLQLRVFRRQPTRPEHCAAARC